MNSKFLIICLLFCSGLLNAQQNKLIYKKNSLKSENKANSILQKCKANKSVEFVNIDLENLTNNDDFVLQLGQDEFSVKKEKVNVRGIKNFSFTGSNKSKDGGMVMSILGDDIQGTITKGDKVYRIETVGKDDYAVVLMDHAELQEKCNNLVGKKHNHKSSKHLHDDDLNQNVSHVDENSANLKSSATESCKIRVAVFYTPAAKASVSNILNTAMLAVEETNQSFLNSGINYELELVYVDKFDYTEINIDTDLARFSADNNVQTIKMAHSADVCVLLNNDAQWCGVADEIGATSSSAFCVVKAYNCATGYFSFGHEIGHLLGCRHDTRVDNNSTPFSYGHGYVAPNKAWRTIMAYGTDCNNCTRLQYWSNPGKTYAGLAMGTSATNNNVKVWNERASTVAAFNQPPDALTAHYIHGNEFQYSQLTAKETIAVEGDIDILSGFRYYVTAGEKITFDEGFAVNSGAHFIASIDNISDCTSSLKQADLAYSNQDNDNIGDLTDEETFSYSVFPNPASEYIDIKYSTQKESIVSVSLVDFLGKKVKEVQSAETVNGGSHETRVTVSELTEGTYFVIFKIDERSFVKKIIVN